MVQISLKKLKYANRFGLNHVKYLIGPKKLSLGCSKNNYNSFVIISTISLNRYPV